jgi:hypothetical protein
MLFVRQNNIANKIMRAAARLGVQSPGATTCYCLRRRCVIVTPLWTTLFETGANFASLFSASWDE